MNNAFVTLRNNQIDKPNSSRVSLKTHYKLNNSSYYHNECIDNSYNFCPLTIYMRDRV
jgi:hypothetical protein